MDDHEPSCEKCKKRRATWHLTEFIDGRRIEQHFCDECYASTDESPHKMEAAFRRLIAAVVPELSDKSVPRCSVCNLDYLEFRQQMRLGCPNDYEVFDAPLAQLLERIHGSARHNGKEPVRGSREAAVHNRLRSLLKQQKKAIAEEDYELAAELRDRIGKLKKDGLDAAEG